MNESEKYIINEETKRKFYWRQFVKLVRDNANELQYSDEENVCFAFDKLVKDLNLE